LDREGGFPPSLKLRRTGWIFEQEDTEETKSGTTGSHRLWSLFALFAPVEPSFQSASTLLGGCELFGGGGRARLQGLFQLHYSSFSSSWGYLSMVLKKAHPYGTDDFFGEKRGFYPR
jgi:hypothetical protein